MRLARSRKRSGWHIALFIIPLISWASLASIAAILNLVQLNKARNQQQERPHPLQFLPDVKGENPGGKVTAPRPQTYLDLPDNLKVALGQTVDLDELEVQPLSIAWGTIELTDGKKGTPYELNGKALKLNQRYTPSARRRRASMS